MLQTLVKNTLGLGLLAGLMVAGIGWVDRITQPYIQISKTNQQHRLLADMLTGLRFDNQPLQDKLAVTGLSQGTGYAVRYRRKLVASILPVTAPDGYSGDIHLLLAVKPDGTLLAVRTLAHQETPGIGDGIDIEKSDWITRFNGLSLSNTTNWTAEHFDGLTRATITSRAIVRAVHRALLWHKNQPAQQP